jgi:hypothetical protein
MALALDDSAAADEERPAAWTSLHECINNELLPAFALAVNDVGLAEAAMHRAAIRSHQRSTPKTVTPQQIWADAFEWVTVRRWPRRIPEPIGPAAIRTTDELTEAVAELPARQRSALVCDGVLGWTDAEIADAHSTLISTIDLRRRRGLGEIRRTLDDATTADLVPLLPQVRPLPEEATVRRAGVRRTFRNRALGLAVGIAGITLAGLAIQAGPDDASDDVVATNLADPPRESRAPYAPIGDGRGGFVAFGRGSGEISVSTDGTSWTERARLNVNRIDLRLFAERFYRSGDQYVMLIDSTTGGGASLSASDSPRIALTNNLVDWTLLRLDLGELPLSEGLRPQIDLLSAAVIDDTVLVSVRINQEIDHRSLGLVASQVCTTTDDRDGLLLHLCDGTVVPVAEQGPAVSGTDRLFVSENGSSFEELPVPAFYNPWGIVAFGDQFGMLEESSNQLYLSDDGVEWEPFFELGVENRLGLIESQDDELLVISPDRSGWTSNLISGDTAITGSLPLGLDPTTIWIKPQVAVGPAGWAVYLTTSRPWDRREDTVSGWAVHIDDWIIEQRPERSSIRLRSTSTNLLYEYHGLIDREGLILDHPSVRRSQFGGVQLFHPETGDLVVDISGQRIRDAWVSGQDTTLSLSGVRSEPGQGRVEAGGWSVEGNIRTGPITLVGPDGEHRVFDDGYAFTNGSTADGIEATIASSQTDGVLSFYDETGGVLVEFDAESVLDNLDPEPDDSEDRARAMVLFSPDGVTWEQLWSTNRPTWYGSVAVGDDEILLSTAAFATGPERIPLDQSDS